MVEVSGTYKHDRYEKIWLNSLNVMSNIEVFATQAVNPLTQHLLKSTTTHPAQSRQHEDNRPVKMVEMDGTCQAKRTSLRLPFPGHQTIDERDEVQRTPGAERKQEGVRSQSTPEAPFRDWSDRHRSDGPYLLTYTLVGRVGSKHLFATIQL